MENYKSTVSSRNFFFSFKIFVITDRNALYLVNTSASGAQMYDLLAASIAERKA